MPLRRLMPAMRGLLVIPMEIVDMSAALGRIVTSAEIIALVDGFEELMDKLGVGRA